MKENVSGCFFSEHSVVGHTHHYPQGDGAPEPQNLHTGDLYATVVVARVTKFGTVTHHGQTKNVSSRPRPTTKEVRHPGT